MKPVLILLAKAAIAAPAHSDLQAMAAAAQNALPEWRVVWTFGEQGTPSLRAQLVADAHCGRIRVLPLSLPAELVTANAISRTVQCWAKGRTGPSPLIEVAPPLSAALPELLGAIATSAGMPPAREVRVMPPPDTARCPTTGSGCWPVRVDPA